jgi:putative oxidoreductase
MLNKITSSLPINKDIGLLVLRLGIGLTILVFHGWGKITGGPDTWTGIGGYMALLGLGFAPVFWGFMAALSESVCSVLLVLGLWVRPAAGLLAVTMLVAALRHLNLPEDNPRAGWSGASHALELLAVYVMLFLTGPGQYTLISLFRRGDNRFD